MTDAYRVGNAAPRASYLAAAKYVAETRVATQTQRRLNPSLRIEVEEAKRSLNEIAQLGDDWDGYGAKPVSYAVRMHAWHALDHFLRAGLAPDVSPNPNGTVSFDWNVNGVRSHFEVGRTKFSMFIESADGVTRYLQGAAADLPDQLHAQLAAAIDDDNPTRSVTSISYASAREPAY